MNVHEQPVVLPLLKVLPLALVAMVSGPASAESVAARQRIAFPDARLEVCGLP